MYINNFSYNYQMSHMAHSVKPKAVTEKSGEPPYGNTLGEPDYYFEKSLTYGGIKAPQAPKTIKDYNEKLRLAVETGMKRLNIVLGRDEKMELSLYENNYIKVKGIRDNKKAKALEKMLNTTRVISINDGVQQKEEKSNLYAGAFYINSAYASSAGSFDEAQRRIMLIGLKNTIKNDIKKQTGFDVELENLYLDEKGIIHGLPKGLFELINDNNVTYSDSDKDMQAIGVSLKISLSQLLKEGYQNIPSVQDIGVVFSFSAMDFPAYMDICI